VYSTSSSNIKGYDPIAYFTIGKATKGNKTYFYYRNGLTQYFSTKKNRALFIENPRKYGPEYDGYCAYSMINGRKSKLIHIPGPSRTIDHSRNITRIFIIN
jgi:YHS domain-containing protein